MNNPMNSKAIEVQAQIRRNAEQQSNFFQDMQK
jgi:hypothetical protein